MAQERIHMPQSGGGIVRYTDDSKSKIEIKPWTVVIMIIVVIVIEALIHLK